jgi:hypothetical protein
MCRATSDETVVGLVAGFHAALTAVGNSMVMQSTNTNAFHFRSAVEPPRLVLLFRVERESVDCMWGSDLLVCAAMYRRPRRRLLS